MAASASERKRVPLHRCPMMPSTFVILCLCFGLALLTGTTESATPLRIFRPGSPEATKNLKADIRLSSQLRVVKEQPWKMRESLWSSVINSNCLRPASMENTTFNVNSSKKIIHLQFLLVLVCLRGCSCLFRSSGAPAFPLLLSGARRGI